MKTYLNAQGQLVREKSWTHPFLQVPSIDGAGGGPKLKQPYANSVWVMRAIKYCVDPIKGLPINFSVDRRGGDVALEDPELTRFWEKPGVTRGGALNRADFMQATAGWLKLAGEAFWILDDSWMTRRMAKSPIIVAKPREMRPILDTDQQLVGWRWRKPKGGAIDLIPDQVVQFKSWNPYDDFRGLSEWEAAKIAADADYAAGIFAANLMANNGDRGPIVVGRDGVASQEQIDQIVAQLREKRERARAGDFRPVFLTGDITVEEPDLQAVDAAYVSQRLENRHEIFLAFGVPPSFAEVAVSYSIGSASDRFKLVEETCMPLAAQIADGVERVSTLFLTTVDTIFAEFDFDEHSTMQQVRRETVDTWQKLTDKGMPPKIAGEYLRMKLPPFPGDEVGRVPFNLVEIEGDDAPVAPAPEPAPAAGDDEDPEGELAALFAARAASRSNPHDAVSKQDDARRKLWERLHRARTPWEKRFEKRFRRHLFEARKETLANIDTARQLEGKAVEHRASAGDLTFELAGWLQDFVRGMLQVSRAAVEQAGFELWTEELGKDDPLTMPAAEVQQALNDRENRIRDAGERVWRQIHDELQEGLLEGETMDELTARTKRAFNGISEERARTIAVTETTVAYESGRDMSMRAAGVQWVEWVTAGDGRERLTHFAADGQVREMGQPFDIGGHALEYPGDPAGPPQEVINCRCVRVARSGPDAGDIIGNEDSDEIPY